MTDVVLDSSAVLALLHGEPGAQVVAANRRGSRLSAVNYAEVILKLIEEGLSAREAEAAIGHFGFEVTPVDAYGALTVGRVEERARRSGASLGDRFCLALAMQLGLPVLTSDRRLATLDLGVEVRLIR